MCCVCQSCIPDWVISTKAYTVECVGAFVRNYETINMDGMLMKRLFKFSYYSILL